eukprot:gene12992-7111_t
MAKTWADCYDDYCRAQKPSSRCKTASAPRVCFDIIPPVLCQCLDPTFTPSGVACGDLYCQSIRPSSFCHRNGPSYCHDV